MIYQVKLWDLEKRKLWGVIACNNAKQIWKMALFEIKSIQYSQGLHLFPVFKKINMYDYFKR